MGRPRGKVKKSAETANSNGSGNAGEETGTTAHERSASPQNPRKDDEADKVDGNPNVEEVADVVKPTVPTKGPRSTTADTDSNGEIKRLRRRRRRQQEERSSETVEDDGKGGDDVRKKPNGFRRNGSRRKNSTPRRAAEAGVECDKC
ncbi:unnamed protein product [Alopecurus aequalis]